MKRVMSILLFAIITTLKVNAYESVFVQNRTWSYLYDFHDMSPSHHLWTVMTELDADTIIDDITYVYDSTEPVLYLYRDDTISQKAYIRLTDEFYKIVPKLTHNVVEYPIYDFKLMYGDTITLYDCDRWSVQGKEDTILRGVKYIVNNVNVIDGRKNINLRMAYNTEDFDESLLNETWIEGVGSLEYMHGIHVFSKGIIPAGIARFMCMHEADNLLYVTEIGKMYNCYIHKDIADAEEQIKSDGMTIFGNPYLCIKSAEDIATAQIKLVDICGRSIIEGRYAFREHELHFPTTHLPKGAYILSIDAKSRITTLKLIVP
jgi:hypothetical protein